MHFFTSLIKSDLWNLVKALEAKEKRSEKRILSVLGKALQGPAWFYC